MRTLKAQFQLTFLSIVLLITAGMAVSWLLMAQVSLNFESAMDEELPQIMALTRLEESLHAMILDVQELEHALDLQDAERRHAAAVALGQHQRQMRAHVDTFLMTDTESDDEIEWGADFLGLTEQVSELSRQIERQMRDSATVAAKALPTIHATLQRQEAMTQAALRHELEEITENYHSAERFDAAARVALLLKVAVIALLSALLARRATRAVSRPLAAVNDVMQRYGRDEFDARITAPLPAEFTPVADTFNHLADDLDRSRDRLVALNCELADKVAQLETATARANEASAAKSVFLSKMSHEIRTPLTVVLGYADLLSEPDLDPAEAQQHVRLIQSSGQHLLAIINDVLDLAKIESGKLTIERASCDPGACVRDVVALLKSKAAEKDLRLDVDIRQPFPSRVVTDATRVRQVLINLAGNAIKFTEKGSVRLVAAYDPATQRLKFDVIDTGIGIDAQQREKLFQPFTQADDSTTRRFGGTGLGLMISRQLAHLLGGEIAVESLPKKGSRFTFIVHAPADAASTVSINPPAQTPEPAAAANVDAAGRVLVAEDAAVNQKLIAAILRRDHFHVELADNGQLAVDAALKAQQAGQPFDVILMDMNMPVMDGYTATRTLRAAGYTRPILALTAQVMAHEKAECLEAGCNDHLSKPIDRRAMTQLIRHYIYQTQAQERAA